MNIIQKILNKRKNWLLLMLLLIGSGGSYLFVKKPWQKVAEEGAMTAPLRDYEDKKYGFRLKYPEGFVVGKISEEDQKQDPLVLKLVRVEPPTLVLSWQEGLGVVSAFIKQPLFDYLKGNIDRKYGAEYDDFKKEKVDDSTLGDLPAFIVRFTFQDPEKEYREKIKLTVAVKDNAGFYLQCMAPEPMWQFAEPACDKIKESFEFIEKEE